MRLSLIVFADCLPLILFLVVDDYAGAWTMRSAIDAVLEAVADSAQLASTAKAESRSIIGKETQRQAQARQAAQQAVVEQQAAGDRDDEMVAGTKIWIAGKGISEVVSFERKMLGANMHTVLCAETDRRTQTLKLREQDWVVL